MAGGIVGAVVGGLILLLSGHFLYRWYKYKRLLRAYENHNVSGDLPSGAQGTDSRHPLHGVTRFIYGPHASRSRPSLLSRPASPTPDASSAKVAQTVPISNKPSFHSLNMNPVDSHFSPTRSYESLGVRSESGTLHPTPRLVDIPKRSSTSNVPRVGTPSSFNDQDSTNSTVAFVPRLHSAPDYSRLASRVPLSPVESMCSQAVAATSPRLRQSPPRYVLDVSTQGVDARGSRATDSSMVESDADSNHEGPLASEDRKNSDQDVSDSDDVFCNRQSQIGVAC